MQQFAENVRLSLMNLNKTSEFEQFFKENYTRFFYFALHILDDEEVSRDIVADAFEYAWKNFRKSDVGNWQTYIYSYIRNKCVDHFRHQSVKEKYADLYLQTTQEADVGYEEQDERVEALQTILATLTPQTRLVLQECYINRKKYKEVADDLEISTNTVKKHIIKALKTIREEIAKKTKLG